MLLGRQKIPRDTFAKRAQGGIGVMVWAVISWKRMTELVVVTGNLNSEDYAQMLEE